MTSEANAGAAMVAQLAASLRDIAERSADEEDRHVIMNAVHTLEACERLLSRAGVGRSAVA